MAMTEPTTRRTVLQGEPPFTVDDPLTFPDDGNRYEFFDGSLFVSPPPAERREAGEVATPLAPFEVSFDPAVLLRRRG